jgi:hypothetical protein
MNRTEGVLDRKRLEPLELSRNAAHNLHTELERAMTATKSEATKIAAEPLPLVIAKALLEYPSTIAADWRLVGKAAIHKDVKLGEDMIFTGPAICRRGTIRGGTIESGTIRGGTIENGTIWGGTIWGGTIWGGTIRGGTIRGGTIWGGTIRGGTIRGGTIRGGTIWGGTIWGGTIWGGTIRGGTIRGGTIRGDNLLLCGLCAWPVTIGRFGEIAVGCECHTPETWRATIGIIAEKHGVGVTEQVKVLAAVALAEKWMLDNPGIVTADKATASGSQS